MGHVLASVDQVHNVYGVGGLWCGEGGAAVQGATRQITLAALSLGSLFVSELDFHGESPD
jgi:hypothetical protein